MAKIFFISEKTIKENTIVPDNLQSQMLQQAITEAQEIYLQEIIGTKMYNHYTELIASGDISKPEYEKYKFLLDEYLTPFLEYRVLTDLQIPLYSKNRNLGVVTTSDTNVNNVYFNDVQKIMQHYQNKAAFYATRISKYLCKHKNEFRDYDHCNCEGFGARTTFYIPTVL